jgi:hypothetical protein
MTILHTESCEKSSGLKQNCPRICKKRTLQHGSGIRVPSCAGFFGHHLFLALFFNTMTGLGGRGSFGGRGGRGGLNLFVFDFFINFFLLFWKIAFLENFENFGFLGT